MVKKFSKAASILEMKTPSPILDNLGEAKIAVAAQALSEISSMLVNLGNLLEPGSDTNPPGLLSAAPPSIQNAARKTVESLKELADLVTDTIGRKVQGEVIPPDPTPVPSPAPPQEQDFEPDDGISPIDRKKIKKDLTFKEQG